jgi:mono/diheme cytochrome c family protein
LQRKKENMRKLIVMGVLALSVALAGSAFANGAAIFRSKCLPCHGPEGKGTAMAPAFQGNEFIKTNEPDVIALTIKNGRAGDQKRYTQFVLAMPPAPLTDAEILEVITYLKSLAGK